LRAGLDPQLALMLEVNGKALLSISRTEDMAILQMRDARIDAFSLSYTYAKPGQLVYYSCIKTVVSILYSPSQQAKSPGMKIFSRGGFSEPQESTQQPRSWDPGGTCMQPSSEEEGRKKAKLMQVFEALVVQSAPEARSVPITHGPWCRIQVKTPPVQVPR